MKHVDTIILVENIQHSKIFYETVLGLEILHDWETMVIFKPRFSLHQADRLLPHREATQFCHAGAQGAGNVIVYFEVDDIDQAYQQIVAHGVEFVHGIVELPWQKIFRLYDPDHHIVEIGESHS